MNAQIGIGWRCRGGSLSWLAIRLMPWLAAASECQDLNVARIEYVGQRYTIGVMNQAFSKSASTSQSHLTPSRLSGLPHPRTGVRRIGTQYEDPFEEAGQ
jgi:hypothetical protein